MKRGMRNRARAAGVAEAAAMFTTAAVRAAAPPYHAHFRPLTGTCLAGFQLPAKERSGSDTAKRFPTASGSLVPARHQSRRRGTDAIEAPKKRCRALFCFGEFSCFVLGLSKGSRISDISQGFDKRSGRSRCRLGTYLRFDADIPQEMSSPMPSRPLVDLHSGPPWDQSGPVCSVNTGPQSGESERRCEKTLRHMHPLHFSCC
ncbi:hypothetical protein RB213_004232 [Colletotrichum asianum]